VKTLLHGVRDAGPGTVTWDGASAAGEKTPNGVYFIRMFAPGEKRTLVRKVTLTR
jgi:flagellar hook assembly protein FlgD